jgi:hypothetical protein
LLTGTPPAIFYESLIGNFPVVNLLSGLRTYETGQVCVVTGFEMLGWSLSAKCVMRPVVVERRRLR